MPKQSKPTNQKKAAHEYCTISYVETEKAITYTSTVVFLETYKKASGGWESDWYYYKHHMTFNPTNIDAKARLFVSNQNSSRYVGHVRVSQKFQF